MDDGRVGRHWDELDQMKRDGMAEVDVGAGLEAARRESERMDRLVAPKVAGDQFEYKVRIAPFLTQTTSRLTDPCFFLANRSSQRCRFPKTSTHVAAQ